MEHNNASGNGSSDALQQQQSHVRHLLFLYSVPLMMALCVPGIFFNAYILASLRFLNRPMSPQILITLSLCAANVVMSATMLSTLTTQSLLPTVFHYNMPGSQCLGLLHEGIRMGSIVSCVLHLLALTTNHYIGVTRPLHYGMVVTPIRVRLLLALLWIIPIGSFLVFFASIPGQGFQSTGCQVLDFTFYIAYRGSIAAMILTPVLVMALMYIHVICVLLKRTTEKLLTTSTASRPNATGSRVEFKTMMTTSLYVLSFIVGWVPPVIMWLSFLFLSARFRTDNLVLLHFLYVIGNMMMIVKPLFDAFLYAMRNKELRLAIYLMQAGCCGGCCQSLMLDRIDSERLQIHPDNARKRELHSTIMRRRADRSTSSFVTAPPAATATALQRNRSVCTQPNAEQLALINRPIARTKSDYQCGVRGAAEFRRPNRIHVNSQTLLVPRDSVHLSHHEDEQPRSEYDNVPSSLCVPDMTINSGMLCVNNATAHIRL